VELFLNGVSLGKKVVKPYRHVEWMVKYAPGKLVAKGIRKGKTIQAEQETTGAPAAIRLTADRSKLFADNADLAVVKVEVVDAKGRLVPIADNRIRFSIEGAGKIIGVGNGDPSCHESDKASERSAFNGLAQVIVQSTYVAGKIKLTATADGLAPATANLQTQP
jgi:beta-galactosidase